jgi:predicted permease
MYLFIFIEYAGRLLIDLAKPFETSGTAPGAFGNIILIPLSPAMLYLSLRNVPVAKSLEVM